MDKAAAAGTDLVAPTPLTVHNVMARNELQGAVAGRQTVRIR